MDKEFFMNGGMPHQLQYDHPFAWQSLTSTMEMQSTQSSDCFLSTPPPNDHFESALSSMVSSPGASNSAMSNDNFMIRELIGKLGNICNSNDILHSSTPPPYINGANCSTNNSCYSTPLNSPPKMGISMPIMDHLVKENFPSLGKSVNLGANLPAMPGDPGFAERAARFSSFGSRSFNGRTNTSQMGVSNPHKNGEFVHAHNNRSCSNLGKLQRVSSSPSLKAADGSQAENNKISTNERRHTGNSDVDHQNEFVNSRENSSVSGQNHAGESGSSRKRKAAVSKGKGKDVESQSQVPSNSNKVTENGQDSSAKRSKSEESNGKDSGDAKSDDNNGEDDGKKQNQKPPEAPKDYIHVRARRGQATDSHSLAERVRREKIGERMKLLQDLVPGCNKVTGKALMLDEIINYVQSLQRQVEFLSMKLSSVNPSLEFNMGSLFSKDVTQPSCSLPHPMYPSDSFAPNFNGQPHQNPLQDSITTRRDTAPCLMDPLNPTINQNHRLHLRPIDGFSNGLPQLSALCEGDLQSIVQMGFGQKENGFEVTTLHGTNPTPMKVEF